MLTYEFVAIGQGGERVQGTERAANEIALDLDLESRGLVLTSSKVVSEKATVASCGMSRDELGLFTTQLATVISAGIPMVEGLEGIGKRLKSPRSQNLLKHMVTDIRAGESLSEAMSPFPKVFPVAYQASVRAGEAAGSLDTVLLRLAAFLDWSRTMRSTTMQALIYPAILMLAIFGLILLLLFYVMPQLLSLFPKGEHNLPWQTELVMGVSDFIRANVAFLGIGLAAVVAGLVLAWKHPRVRVALGRVALRVPLLGGISKQLATSRFVSTASTLQGAGCSVFMVLEVAADTCGSVALTEVFKRSIEGVRKGKSISEALGAEPLVDPLLVQMVGVGERAGALDRTLEQLANYYDNEVPRAVKKLLTLLEPLLLLGAGGIVAFILMAAMLPLFELYENIG